MLTENLSKKAAWVRTETLRLHGSAPETRVASALSCVEILTTLYYGDIIKYFPANPRDGRRDRFVISKAHGVLGIYPILADLGFFEKNELDRICQAGAKLGGIPDMVVPGFETINGSLGHGLGEAFGMAIGLNRKNKPESVFVLLGDGELYEGSIWEAVMLAGEHKLDNLIAIVDNNKACMLDFCKNIIDLAPLGEKFAVFGWQVETVDGHDTMALRQSLSRLKKERSGKPKLLIAETVKGKGVPALENDPLSHIKVLKKEAVEKLIGMMS